MNKTTLNVIEKALRLKSRQVCQNKTWQMLYDEHHIGTKTADSFSLSDNDFDCLLALYRQYVKTEDREKKDTKNRLITTQYYANEKWAKRGVFEQYLVLACPSCPLPTKTGERLSGKGCLLLVDCDEIEVEKIDKIVVVENGTLIAYCEQWYQLLPKEWQSAIFLYRGHGANAKYVNELIEKINYQANIAIYADLDLSGLDIVASYAKKMQKDKKMHIILPKDWKDFYYCHRDNQPWLFAKQNAYKRQYTSEILTEIYRHLIKHQLALTQENVLNLGELAVYMI